ncbi:hypothetical protein ACFGVS_26915 [Mucilaginibacter sp. AW1-7]|uniref:hypothetical protein n=1 Tax=Mucilaginibacter sp. AW1-7 TaxID=3349874 RepID=UPI003F733FC5
MTKKQYLELIPLSIFLLAGLSALFKVPYSGLIAVVFGGVTATLYCPLSLWLYASAGVSLINRILIDVAYSLAIVALLFCFLHWANWQFECIMSYGALLVAVVICAANYSKPAYKPFLWRCVFFAVLITLVYTYRKF